MKLLKSKNGSSAQTELESAHCAKVMESATPCALPLVKPLLALALSAALVAATSASENAPHRPFAQWADLPAPDQFVLGAVYE